MLAIMPSHTYIYTYTDLYICICIYICMYLLAIRRDLRHASAGHTFAAVVT